MKTYYILGSLDYHDDTILKPILNELKNNCFYKSARCVSIIPFTKNKDVHISEYVDNCLDYWDSLVHKAITMVKDGDVVLIADFWFPPIITLKYYFEQKGMNVKFFALHHGSTHLPDDFATKFGSWAASAEDSWLDCYERVFVGSNSVLDLMKKNTPERYEKYKDKFVVSYLPITYTEDSIENVRKFHDGCVKSNSVIFPLRLSPDKGAKEFIEFVKLNPQFTFFVASPSDPDNEYALQCEELGVIMLGNLDREQLYKVFMSTEYVFSWAGQETFGYSVIEAVLCGCYPILCNKNVYQELYPPFVRWEEVKNVDVSLHNKYQFIFDFRKIGNPQKVIVDHMMRNL